MSADKTMTVDRLREAFDLDAETGTLRWRITRADNAKAGQVAGTPNGDGYLRVMLDRKRLRVHRVVFAMVNGYFPEQVDHVNGDRSDNRPANLRAATGAENTRNARLRADNTSGTKGVTWHSQTGKWHARCALDGRTHYLGLHYEISAAAAAVRAFRERHHGEFARHE